MKKIAGKIIAIFLIFGVSGGIIALKTIGTGVGLGIFAIFKIMPHLPTSIFDLFEKGIVESWSLTGNNTIDSVLLNVALIIPSVISFLISSNGFKINNRFSVLISFLTLILVLELFCSYVFWTIAVIIIILLVSFAIYNKYGNSYEKEQEIKVEEAKQETINKNNEEKDKSKKLYNLFELWILNNSTPFKAYSNKTNIYVYIKKDPLAQYNKYKKVYGYISPSMDTYNKGKNTELFNVADKSWEIV